MRFSMGLSRLFPVVTDDERSNTPWRSSIKSRRVPENFRPFADPVNSRLVIIVAGEASADLHGSHLVAALKRLDPGLDFWGIGGSRLQEAGVRILFNSSDMAVVGLTEVVSRLATVTRAYRTLKSILRKNRPALLILMDYPDFNLRLARAAKRFQVPVLYYIGPQVWAWRKGRVETIRRCVDRMAVILPFEKDFYRERGLHVEHVGHPLLEEIPMDLDGKKVRMELGLDQASPVLALLPGSRKEEVTNLLPVMVEAAERIRSTHARMKCLLPRASTIPAELLDGLLKKSTLDVRVIQGDVHRVLKACDLALVASGTATLEAAILETPMIIVYRVSSFSYWIGRMVISVPFIGLVNLVAGEEVVPELIQGDVTPVRLAREAMDILDHDERRRHMVGKLRALRETLGQGSASERTARIALEMIEASSS
jgi:lipid-A-disaccharide synthase